MFAEKLINWYAEHGRKLPWRETDNPYFIWLSEIILQQTRIEQGRSYYEHFVATYPTVADLAEATEEQVLKSWQGLGYYSRARNLHAAAQYVAHDLGGEFPSTYDGILRLKGVGRYTAAAIASFAFRLPHPVIDGNVYRLISRLYGIFTPIGTDQAYREFEQRLLILMDKNRPDLFNQAIMDFGSIYCKPTGCNCENCIFSQECFAHKAGKIGDLPVKPQKVEVKERFFYYIDVTWGDCRLMQQRQAGDIWQGLYELPLLETEPPIAEGDLEEHIRKVATEWFGTAPDAITAGLEMKHQLTHRTIKARFLTANYHAKPPRIPSKMKVVEAKEQKSLPISRLIDRYLSKL